MSKIIKNIKGFTLFETIIYIGIAGIILVSFVQFSLTISGSRNKNYAVQEVQANARTALDIISQKIRMADAVTSPVPGGPTTNSLSLTMPGDDIVFDLSGVKMQMAEGVTTYDLTSGKVSVTSFNFTNLAVSGERDSIKIEFTIEYANPGDIRFTSTQTIQTVVGLRK